MLTFFTTASLISYLYCTVCVTSKFVVWYFQVYDIDGIGVEDPNEDDKLREKQDRNSPSRGDKKPVKSSKQILLNAGQKSEFDSGMNNCQLNNSSREIKCSNSADTTYCTPVYGQIVSTRENHNEINEIQQKFASSEPTKPSSSLGKDYDPAQTKGEGWDEFSKCNKLIKPETDKKRCPKDKSKVSNGKAHFDFFPVFDNKANDGALTCGQTLECSDDPAVDCDKQINVDNSKIILEPMQKLVLHSTDNKICDNKPSALSSLSS